MKSYILIAFWFVALSLPLTYLMGTHSVALNPSKNNKLISLVPSSTKKNKALHILGINCICSENVFQSLRKRKSEKDIVEKVIIIGKNEEWVSLLHKQGFIVESISSKEMAQKYLVNATPQLTVFNNENEMIYSGGYTNSRSIASEIEDLKILKKIINSKSQEELPVYGCLSETI